MLSQATMKNVVKFPDFRPERIYMMPFKSISDLPSRWQPTVTEMLAGLDIPSEAYLMVDCKRLHAGELHRRGGMHVDGNWIPERHDNPSPGHRVSVDFVPDHIVVAGSHTGCRAYPGHYYGPIAPDGQVDEEWVNKRLGKLPLFGGLAYLMNASTIHESLPAWGDYDRSFVRINIPQPKVN